MVSAVKDFFANELAIGDTVAFEQPGYRSLIEGTIVAFTPKQIRVVYTYQGSVHKYIVYPCDVVKRPAAAAQDRSAELLKLHDDTIALVKYSASYLNNPDYWEASDHLGPMWQEIYDRRSALSV